MPPVLGGNWRRSSWPTSVLRRVSSACTAARLLSRASTAANTPSPPAPRCKGLHRLGT